MALLQNPNSRWWCGGIYQFTYSPIALINPYGLEQYDKYPLGLFINMDTSLRHPLFSMINLHWLTVQQRRQLLNIISYNYPNISEKAEWHKPINFTWQHVQAWFPIGRIAWRRYYPGRIRNVQLMSGTWQNDEIEEIINSNTQKIMGITPELIQKHFQMSQARAQRLQRQRHAEHLAKIAPKPKKATKRRTK